MPALLAGWIYIFLITFKELSIALLLYSPGSQVVAVTIWELWDNGHVGELAAFSLVITIGTVRGRLDFPRNRPALRTCRIDRLGCSRTS